MKAVLLTPELFVEPPGGIARAMRGYLRALGEDAAHTSLAVVSLNDPARPPEDIRPHLPRKPVAVHTCARSIRVFLRSTWREAGGAQRLVCGHLRLLPPARLARLRNPRLQLYLVAHGIEVDRPLKPSERWALRGVERIWCVSTATRDAVLKRVPEAARKTWILPNGLDPVFEDDAARRHPTPNGFPPSAPIVLTVARLDRRDAYKGIDALISIWPSVLAAQPSAQLRIAGSGDDRARLEQLASELRVRASIQFLGAITDQQLGEEYAQCQLFALPSTREGFGLVFVEAFAYGKPCIGARAGGATDVIDDTCGRLVTPGDGSALLAAINESWRHHWSADLIRARAAHFSHAAFRRRLAAAWTGSPP